ncbi:NitT/TauT family transport system substrate-binding protein [Lipingzhangella halophila]|uniref:NitT/TauT family transport system substrate-binding protein n=1 Tax=Lipingzhangella halophila TaxID=1783352 RepID=A0A7W7RIX5_9ACTN|nr:ABC transporter substrate-binding protein [Lipingzhangella halophila]MBB4932837.1 NitT/TauT family transport system substrate-binding protein [Lipingzhangella halophila]
MSRPHHPPRPPAPGAGRRTRRRHSARAAAAVALLLALTACGVGQGSAIEIEEGDVIRIGVVPTASFAPLYIAIEEGYFEREGLEVELQMMDNAAAVAPSVLNGQLQIGTAATSPFISAISEGLPLRAIANATVNSPPDDDETALVVAEDSPVTQPRDLEGRKVAVNGLGALPYVAAMQAIREDGGDPGAVTFVSVPFADMGSAVANGRVDAAALTEPFLSQSEAAGNTILAGLYSAAFAPESTTTLYFTALPFIETNPEVVERFVRAVNGAGARAVEEPELVAEVLAEYGGMDPDIAGGIRLPEYGTDLSADGIAQVGDVMLTNGLLEEPIDAGAVIHDD